MFHALSDRVLVSRDEAAEVSTGGVILAAMERELPTTGTVQSAGPGARALDGSLIPNAVDVGNKVSFSPYAGQEIEVDGQEYVLLRESDIFGILS